MKMLVNTVYGEEPIKGRVCSYCKVLKSLDNYWFKHGGKSKALRYVCKECETIQKRHVKKLKEDEIDFFESKPSTQNDYINLDDDLPF